MAMRASAAENLKSRERKLRRDAMCIVLSPQRVRCRRCSTEISLSKKSDYDPCHWNKHRERCLKRKSNRAASDKSRDGHLPSLTSFQFAGTCCHHHFLLPILPFCYSIYPSHILSSPTGRKIFNSQCQRAICLASDAPSLSPDVGNDYEANIPLSPVPSIFSGLPSPVSLAQPLARSTSPTHSHLELSRSTPPKAKSDILNLINSPITLPDSMVPPLSDFMSINCPSSTLISKGSLPPKLLAHGNPLEFSQTERFRWSDLRTSYPHGSEPLPGGSGCDSGSVSSMYTLSTEDFDQYSSEEGEYCPGTRFATSSCRFSH